MNSSAKAQTIIGANFSDVYKQVAAYYKQNNIAFDPRSLAKDIISQNGLGKKSKQININLSLSDAVSGAKALLNHATGTSASNEEIKRRAAICAACPLMSTVTNCMVCGGSRKVANLVSTIKTRFGAQTAVPDNVKKNYCEVCGCSLALLIVTKFENIKPESPEKIAKRPQYCWLNPNSSNFTNE